jgi:Flp pilus assembly protein TadG
MKIDRNTRSRGLLQRLRSDKTGNSLIEFAFGMPILLSVSMLAAEIANLTLVHMRVSQLSHVTADNIARVRDRIDEVDINDAFQGAAQVGGQIEAFQNGRIVVSLLEDNAATTGNLTDNKILWQRCKGEKTTPTNLGVEGDVLNAGMGLPGRPATVATKDNSIVFVEVYYKYTPIITWAKNVIGESKDIRYSSSYTIRDRANNAMQNAQSLSGTNKTTCNYYNSTV